MKIVIFCFILPIVYLLPFEALTYTLHKYVMHGFGWCWHQSHHQNPGGSLEKNDLFGLIFAIIAIGLFYLAVNIFQSYFLLSIAIGLTLYGCCYFFLHDILIHRRLNNRLFRKIKSSYLKRLIRAHAIHHKISTKEGCEAFGFLYAPKKYKFPG